MRTSKQYWLAGLSLSFAWLLGAGCGAASKDSGTDRSMNEGGSNVGGSKGAPTIVDPDAGSLDGGTLVKLNPLCGVGDMAGSCVPDDPRACSTFVPPAVGAAGGAGGEQSGGGGGEQSGGGGGGAGVGEEPGGAGGFLTEGGQGGVPGAGGDVGVSGGGTEGGAGGSPEAGGGQGGEGNPNPAGVSFSCQVTRQNNQPARECTAAGTGAANAPCFTALDCAAGLACVSDGDAGRCRPYCCDPETACESGAYCAERPLRRPSSDLTNSEPPHVPVCVPAENCSLEERFPCPANADCRCKGNTACMVVRDDGSTDCLEPGTGSQGDACPCAWNHVCSSMTNQCVKLCRTDTSQNDCGAQKCQASSELPKNFGVCVGPI